MADILDDFSTDQDFERNAVIRNGEKVEALNLNRGNIRLKKEVNHLHALVYSLMKGNKKNWSGNHNQDEIVNFYGKYFISKERNNTAHPNDTSKWTEIQLPVQIDENTKVDIDLSAYIKKSVFDGQHAAGGTFEEPFLNMIEQTMIAYSSTFESQAEIMRIMGASGMFSTRQYTYDEAFDPKERIFGVTYNAMGQHNHPDYRGMPGTAELSVMANGYYVRTRHNDYRIYAPVQGGYLARKEILPPLVPAYVDAMPLGSGNGSTNPFQAGTQYEFMKNIYVNNPETCVFYLSYMEVWWETFSPDDTGDYTDSFRHSNDANSMKQMLEKALYLNSGGHKNRLENIPFSAVTVRRISDTGVPVLAALRYRINSYPVASMSKEETTQTFKYSDNSEFTVALAGLPYNEAKATVNNVTDADNKFGLRKDLRQKFRKYTTRSYGINLKGATRVNIDNAAYTGEIEMLGNVYNIIDRNTSGQDFIDLDSPLLTDIPKDTLINFKDVDRSLASQIRSGRATFDLGSGKLMDLCQRVPGMMGQGASIIESYNEYELNDNVTDYNSSSIKNAAYYNHEYSMIDDDASGRNNAHRSFNDPNLFVAKTDDAKVVDGFSYMIPLELVLRTPIENWDPYKAEENYYPENRADTRVKDGKTQVAGAESDFPLNNSYYNRYNFKTPADLYVTPSTDGTDDADTRNKAWVETPNDGVKFLYASGTNLIDYSGQRKRFAIFAEYQDYSKPGSDLELYKKAMAVVLEKIRLGTATAEDISDLYN